MTVRQLPMADQLPQQVGVPRFEQVFHIDHRACTCEIPMISKKWNDALGRMVNIRLCCLAKALEQLLGEEAKGALYQVFEFNPRWEWDCKEMVPKEDPNGTKVMMQRGRPPKWLQERMQEKGIPIHNLPE